MGRTAQLAAASWLLDSDSWLLAPFPQPMGDPTMQGRTKFPELPSNINYINNEIGSVKKGREGIGDFGLWIADLGRHGA